MNSIEQTRDKLTEMVRGKASEGVELMYDLSVWYYKSLDGACFACLIECVSNTGEYDLNTKIQEAAYLLNIEEVQAAAIERGFEKINITDGMFLEHNIDIEYSASLKPWYDLGVEFRDKANDGSGIV